MADGSLSSGRRGGLWHRQVRQVPEDDVGCDREAGHQVSPGAGGQGVSSGAGDSAGVTIGAGVGMKYGKLPVE